MPTNLLADNWTFQNAGEFMCQGLDGDTAHELMILEQGDGFHYAFRPTNPMIVTLPYFP